MSRFARVVVPDVPHHLVHRGNRRQTTFLSDDDRHRYLELLRGNSMRHGLDIWAYCLMPNHIHVVAVPRSPESLARALGHTQWQFAQWLNRRTRRTGHLWENRFYSCPLDQAHLWCAARYVERNPVRAGMVECCEDFRWSSARAHCFETPDSLLAPDRPFPGHRWEWRDWLRAELEDLELERLRAGTRAGRPVGDEDFVRLLEAKLGRSLAPLRRLKSTNSELASA